MQLENLLTFLDPGFDRLASGVEAEPAGQILGDRGGARVEQGSVLDPLAIRKALQADIQRVAEAFELAPLPGEHFGLGSDPGPGCIGWNLAEQAV